MRLYLDTNIIIFLLEEDVKSIDSDTYAMLSDDGNTLFTSAICLQELIHLRQTGKLFAEKKKKKDHKKREPMVDMVKELGINVVPVNEFHLRELDALPIVNGHRDPFDRLIIAQAIADKATLVSSDTQFPHYEGYGLMLHQNFK